MLAHRPKSSTNRTVKFKSLKKFLGWSLLESVIVIGILLVLGVMVLPAYQDLIRETRREHAESYLMGLSIKLEDYFIRHGSYSGVSLGVERDTPAGYRFEVLAKSSDYKLVAIPIGQQTKDRCGQLSVDNQGIKQAVVSGCWQAY